MIKPHADNWTPIASLNDDDGDSQYLFTVIKFLIIKYL